MIAKKRLKALVMDDEVPFEELLPAMMDRLGWDCEVVACPEKAMERLKSEDFDILIADYHMPQGNGFHFICCLRRDGITVPAIVMSGDSHILRSTPRDLLNIPAVLLKPFAVADLSAALHSALSA